MRRLVSFLKFGVLPFTVFLLFLNSCQIAGHNNFTRQKFTKLKPFESHEYEFLKEKQPGIDVLSNTENFTQKSNEVIPDRIDDERPRYPESQTIEEINNDHLTCRVDLIKTNGEEIEFDDLNVSVQIIENAAYQNEKTILVDDEEEPFLMHKKKGRRFFLGSLVCLLFFILAIVLLFGFFGQFVSAMAMIMLSVSFITGYVFLAASAYHSKIYKSLEPKKFSEDAGAITIHVFTILGMLLFGCFPFLIPFGLVWMVVNKQVKEYLSNNGHPEKK